MYQWQPIQQESIPSDLIAWLRHAGNLTEKLAKIANYHFACLNQAFMPIPDVEQQLLKQTTEHALVRNVMHNVAASPLVIARTVISEALYQQNQLQYDNLGNQPIGQTLLYQKPNMIRSSFEYAIVANDSIILQPFKAYLTLPQHLYARRSIFTLETFTLLIIEFFLPTITHYEY